MEQLEKPKKAEFGPADDYTKNFILEKGGDSGYRKVAREIGAVPATLQQVVEQRNKAGRDTITKLYLYYKDFDLVMAMTGKPGNQPAIEAQVQTSPTTIQDGVDWQSRFNTLEKKYDALFAEYQSLVAIMASKLKMSFSVSSGQTTVEEVFSRMVVSGFVQNEFEADEVKIIPLNSLDIVRPMYRKATA